MLKQNKLPKVNHNVANCCRITGAAVVTKSRLFLNRALPKVVILAASISCLAAPAIADNGFAPASVTLWDAIKNEPLTEPVYLDELTNCCSKNAQKFALEASFSAPPYKGALLQVMEEGQSLCGAKEISANGLFTSPRDRKGKALSGILTRSLTGLYQGFLRSKGESNLAAWVEGFKPSGDECRS